MGAVKGKAKAPQEEGGERECEWCHVRVTAYQSCLSRSQAGSLRFFVWLVLFEGG